MIYWLLSALLAVSPAFARASARGESSVESYLTKTLKLEPEEANRYLLTKEKIHEINLGFGHLNRPPINDSRDLDPEVREALLKDFSPVSGPLLLKLVLALSRDRYANAMLIGPAGAGKSFAIDQLVTLLSFGLVPDFLRGPLGIEGNDSHFLKELREAFFRNTQIVVIDNDLLSLDNTKPGNAFAKADIRMRALLSDLFRKAREDFQKNRLRTVFVMEEVATLPPLVQQTLKRLLDKTGFKTRSASPTEKGSEVGYSVIAVTTPEEYRQMINADSAVERRYEKVIHLEPTEEQAFAILKGKRDAAIGRFGFLIEDDVLWYLISMRKFFATPPLAMPDSVLKVMDGFMSWATDPQNRKHGDELTIDEAYAYLIHQSHLPKETWIPANPENPPLWDLLPRVRKHVVSQDDAIERIARRLKTGRTTGFREVPIFFLMGPSGSGKDTIARAFNLEMFGHDGAHLKFSIAGSNESRFRSILEVTPEGELPLLARALEDGRPNGVIVFNEAKDLPSGQFDLLKTILDDGVLRPSGRDTRPRPLGLNAIFIMGQWGEELFDGKSPDEIADIVRQTDEKKLIEILRTGSRSGQKGAVPMALIQRAIRNGGIILLPPVRLEAYAEIVRQQVAEIVAILKRRSAVDLEVDEQVINFAAKTAIDNDMSPRGLEGVIKDLTEAAITEAQEMKPPLPLRNVAIRISLEVNGEKSGPNVVITRLKSPQSKEIEHRYLIPAEVLLRSRCNRILGIDEQK